MTELETDVSFQERPWERLPGEGEHAWAAFQTYRNLGHKRSIPRVIEALGLECSDSRMQWLYVIGCKVV